MGLKLKAVYNGHRLHFDDERNHLVCFFTSWPHSKARFGSVSQAIRYIDRNRLDKKDK